MIDNLYDQIIMPSIECGALSNGKRSEAVLKVWRKLAHYPGWMNDPKQDAKNEKEYNFRQNFTAKLEPTIIWAPSLSNAGEAFAVKEEKGRAMVYLSPTLEFESMPSVMHTVCHELCHIALGHHRQIDVEGAKAALAAGLSHDQKPHELEADALCTKLGFPKPKNYSDSFLAKIIDLFVKGKGSRSRRMLANALGIALGGTNG